MVEASKQAPAGLIRLHFSQILLVWIRDSAQPLQSVGKVSDQQQQDARVSVWLTSPLFPLFERSLIYEQSAGKKHSRAVELLPGLFDEFGVNLWQCGPRGLP